MENKNFIKLKCNSLWPISHVCTYVFFKVQSWWDHTLQWLQLAPETNFPAAIAFHGPQMKKRSGQKAGGGVGEHGSGPVPAASRISWRRPPSSREAWPRFSSFLLARSFVILFSQPRASNAPGRTPRRFPHSCNSAGTHYVCECGARWR